MPLGPESRGISGRKGDRMNELISPQRSFTPGDLFALLAEQVSSYQHYYHLGNSTSIPAETARELLRSIQYTLTIAPEGLRQGQAILTGRLEEAKRLYRLVAVTESNQSSWFWDTMQELSRYLDRYDPLHFAHRGPELMCYPIALPIPEGIMGVEEALFYLRCLWMENQILDCFPDGALRELQSRLPSNYWDGPEILCQQPLLNAAGRVLLGLPLDTLILGEFQENLPHLTQERILQAGETVCKILSFPAGPAAYAQAVLRDVLPRLLSAKDPGDLFL